MNGLVDGEWVVGGYDETDDEGRFERQEARFHSEVKDDPEADFPVESGRYHLYVSLACPWAHRTLITRKLKGLEDVVSVDVVDPFRAEDGWDFTPDKDGCTPDTVNGEEYLREVYLKADPNVTTRVTVPVLWDKERGTIVNNESAEITRFLNTEFDSLAENDVDLYPEEHNDEVDRIIDAIYEPINNGVYKAGFAETQEAYEEAVDELFDALDHWEGILADQRYLAGDRLTEADVFMFTTLVRFDRVYNIHFKCSRRRIDDYENLSGYLRDLYQTPGFSETVDFDHIKEHYYTTHPSVNPKRIIAVDPEIDLEDDHGRDSLPGSPPV
ncbi:glutathione S-transferase family protein [Halorutilales archaeon Cl-col2-1]